MLAWRVYGPCIEVSCLEGHPREPGTPRIFALKEAMETGLGCGYPSCALYISSLVHCLGLELVDSRPWQGIEVVGEHDLSVPNS